MGSRSILRRIARYGISPVRNAREDRLTEVWAAIFDSSFCDGFARHVALSWLLAAMTDAQLAERDRFDALADVLGRDGEWRCHVATQVPLTVEEERRRPDLELTFSGPASLSLWVEIKNGTGPHDGQLSAYVRGQVERGLRNAAVLLVAPRNDYAWFSPNELPLDVPRLSWEDTARSIGCFDGARDDPVQRFLLDELWSYMSDEQLTDPPRLSADHIAALGDYWDARKAVGRLCDIAAEHVRKAWGGTGEPGVYPERGEPRQYWWSHQPDDVYDLLGEDWWWDWKLLMDSTDIVQDGDRRPAVFVGATADRGALARLDDGIKESLAAKDFTLLGPGASNGRGDHILRYRPLDSAVVGDAELPVQAERLANGIEACFRDLQETVAAAAS